MADIDDVAGLPGGEQTPAPVTPAPSEPAPHETAKQTVRKAFEQAQAKAAEKDEQARAPRAPSVSEPAAEGTNEGKPGVDRTTYPEGVRPRDPQGRFAKGEGQEPAPAATPATEAPEPVEQPTGPLTLRPPPGW